MNPDAGDRIRSWSALGVVYLVWGTTYLAIRVGVRGVPPLLFAGIRYVVAGALLLPLAARVSARERARLNEASSETASNEVPSRVTTWIGAGVIGILLLFAGNGGVTYGETSLPSGFAAVLVATVPLWMILFARTLQREPITWRKMLALGLGLAGVVVLVGNLNRSLPLSSVLIVLGAAAAWGFGSVLGQRIALPRIAIFASAIEMLVGGTVLLFVAALSGEFSGVRWSHVPFTSWLALAYLISFGSILAFSAYQYALTHLTAATVSTYAFVNPVVALLAGALILGEHLTLREGGGALFILAAVLMIQLHSRHLQRSGALRDDTTVDSP